MAKKTAGKSKTIFSVHPSISMVQKWVAELPEKTGRSLDQWIVYINKEGPKDIKEQREWLKKVHGHGTNTAWWLAERAAGDPMAVGEENPEVYLANAEMYVLKMFDGPKAGLKPIYDRLIELALSFKGEIKICPCTTIVPFYRNHVIAQIKPTTRTRIDFGYALGDKKGKGRLVGTGGFAKKDRITHKIAIESLKDIDKEVEQYLKMAFERDAK